MPRRLIRRYLPDHRKIREHKHLRLFGERLHDPNLWHLNRRSVAGAIAMGVFVGLLPLPGQMIIAAAMAIWFRINITLAVTTVWITNPFTMAPIFFCNYRVGVWLLHTEPRPFHFELSLHWLVTETNAIWLPLMVGSLVLGILLSIIVYGLIRLAWRLYIIRKRRYRQNHIDKIRLKT